MCCFWESYDCRPIHLLCDLPRVLGWYVVELVLGHPLSFSVKRRPTDPSFWHLKKKQGNDVVKPFFT